MVRLEELTQQALQLVLTLSLPVVLVGVLVAVVISAGASLARWNDPALSHLPRMIAVLAVVAVAGRWGAGLLLRFTTELWAQMPAIAHAAAGHP